MKRLTTRAMDLVAASVFLLSACAHSASNPAPMPSAPDGICADRSNEARSSPDDSDARPLVRVAPMYPKAAYSRGVQGWVCYEFTIAPDGSVEDPAIVASSPEGYFEQAGLTAIRQWKYPPLQQSGEPVGRPGVRVMLKFALKPE